MPEGAADEERSMTTRDEPGDGSEERYNSTRRYVPRYKSDPPVDAYQVESRKLISNSHEKMMNFRPLL